VAGFLAIVGYGIALWGISYLRRSFALMVAVREVVSGGPYAYVRHPMYLGYIFELSGLVLASCSLGMLLAAAGFICLMVVRARLEEGRLIEVSPEYRDYMKRTGFLFPRFHRTPTGTTAVRRA
jgi:protein-S-isoprenylcysteine O-methyltransferase Ste14